MQREAETGVMQQEDNLEPPMAGKGKVQTIS